jgi:hypothetical protein
LKFRSWLIHMVMLFISQGCMMTGSRKWKLYDYKQGKREFVNPDKGVHHVGVFTGIVTVDGTTFMSYQFPTLLKPKAQSPSRLFEVNLPSENSDDIFISQIEKSPSNVAVPFGTERQNAMQSKATAIAIFTDSIGGDTRPVPEALLDDNVKEENLTKYLPHVIYLNAEHSQSYGDFLIVRRPVMGKDGKTVSRWTHQYSALDVEWCARSRAKYAAMHGAYLYTVPLDIVTSPVQILVLPSMMSPTGGH